MSGFWKFTNNYASRVSKLLDKSDCSLEALLDERETVPELLASNTKLLEYLRRAETLEKLVQYILDDDKYELEVEKEQAEDEQANESDISVDQTEGIDQSAEPDETLQTDECPKQTDESTEIEVVKSEDATTTEQNDTSTPTDNADTENTDSTDESSSSSSSDEEDEEEDLDDAMKAMDLADDLQAAEPYSSDSDSDDDEDHLGEEFSMDDESVEETDAEKHTRRAQIAAEILSVDVWSLTDAFTENTDLLKKLWSMLDRDASLQIYSATYFMKINEHLLDMKTSEMIQFILDQPNIVEKFMRHIDTPPLMDFLLKLISTDKPDASTGIIELLKEQQLIPSLISFIGSDVDPSVQNSASDFLKAFITISANNAESTTIGPNELTRELVSEPMVKSLVDIMLHGGRGLSNGVAIIIEIIRKNNSDYDPVPVVYATLESNPPTPRDPISLGTLVKVFADAMPQFTVMLSKKIEEKLPTPFGFIEPLGFERFKICEMVAELIHCSNMALLNDEKGEDIVNERDRIRAKLIERHKQLVREADDGSTVSWDESDIAQEIEKLMDDELRDAPDVVETDQDAVDGSDAEDVAVADNASGSLSADDTVEEHQLNDSHVEKELRQHPVVGDQLKIALYDNEVIVKILNMFFEFPWNNFLHNVVFDIVQQVLNASIEIGYNRFLAIDLFDRGKITDLIVGGYNRCVEYGKENGIRLGYMGHLTLIAEEVVKFVSLNLNSTITSKAIEDEASNPDWEHFVEDILVDTRNKYNAVLGNDGVIASEQEDEFPTEDDGYFDYDQNVEEDDLDENQFSRYMSHEMTSDFRERFGSADDDSEEEETANIDAIDEKDWAFEDDLKSPEAHDEEEEDAEEAEDAVEPEDAVETKDVQETVEVHVKDTEDQNPAEPLEDDTETFTNGDLNDENSSDEYEDPNDDGQSYEKKNHPLYQADGSLNYTVMGSTLAR